MAKAAIRADDLTVRRLTPARMDDMGKVIAGTWGAGCWCMFRRKTATTALPEVPGGTGARDRAAMTALARKRRAGPATSQGAPAVEAYVRPGSVRVDDDSAFFGTESLFRKAGFRKIRGPLPGMPRTWVPRVTMRTTCGTSTKQRARSATA